MKNIANFIFVFSVYVSGFAQNVKRRYFENNSGLRGNMLIKLSN